MQTPFTQTILACGILATTLASWGPGATARTNESPQGCPAVTALKAEDIERNGVTSIEVLQGVPGVSLSGGFVSGGQEGVIVRGVPSGGATSALGQLDGIPQSALNQVEVLKGSYSAVYGVDPLGHVINIITRPQGTLNCRTVDNSLWSEDKAYDGKTLTLPSNAYVIPYSFNEDLKLSSPINRSFGTLNGKFVSGKDWMWGVSAPYFLPCPLGQEKGASTQLTLGDRFNYRVPGGMQDVNWLANQNNILDQYCYGLPDGGGYNCNSAAGSEPKMTYNWLYTQQTHGRIKDLEWDGCEQFHPESGKGDNDCYTGKKKQSEKVTHYQGSLDSKLINPVTGQPIDNAWVMAGPLPPTPFYDPGPRAGDEKGPRLGRTDANGNYRVSLGGLDGHPVEINVAKGCSAHTTVAVADPPKPPEQPASRPKPKAGTKICGPDVTEQVIDILDLMKRVWASWDADTRKEHCWKIVSPRTALGAWDMAPFSPSSYKDLRVVPDYCAIPEWPCGATVEFMGHCVPSQVVNYLQWGAMTRLCKNSATGIALHELRDTANSLLSNLKNVVTLNWGQVSSRPTKGKDYDGQSAMSAIGSYYINETDSRDFGERVMRRLLDRYVREAGDSWWGMDGTDCTPACEETAGADVIKDKFKSLDWGFQWGDSSRTLKQEQVEQELKRLREQRGSSGR